MKAILQDIERIGGHSKRCKKPAFSDMLGRHAFWPTKVPTLMRLETTSGRVLNCDAT